MRGEIGKLELDRTFAERESLNNNVREALNQAVDQWGISIMRYEIKDIKPPSEIKRSMELQAESERIKRSQILTSEGTRQSKVNEAEGIKQSNILEGEGEAAEITQEARSIVESLDNIAASLVDGAGENAVIREEAIRLRLTERYLGAMTNVLDKA